MACFLPIVADDCLGSVTTVILLEKEICLDVDVVGVQVLSLPLGVLFIAEVNEEGFGIGLAGSFELKCSWCSGHRSVPAPSSSPNGEVSHST